MLPPPPPPYFKIVQTFEKQGTDEKKMLAIVPSGWESNGVLMWPESYSQNDFMKRLKDAKSIPSDDHSWTPYAGTKVKRTGIATYKEAEKILKDMMPNSDSSSSTDDGVHDVISETVRRTRKHPLQTNQSAQISTFNAIVSKNKVSECYSNLSNLYSTLIFTFRWEIWSLKMLKLAQ